MIGLFGDSFFLDFTILTKENFPLFLLLHLPFGEDGNVSCMLFPLKELSFLISVLIIHYGKHFLYHPRIKRFTGLFRPMIPLQRVANTGIGSHELRVIHRRVFIFLSHVRVDVVLIGINSL